MLGLGLAALTAMVSVACASAVPPECPTGPLHLVSPVPVSGMTWLEGEENSGRCDAISHANWSSSKPNDSEVWVHADGPSGTGRYWLATVGLRKNPDPCPTRGFCLWASTVGWRTLQSYHRAPLPWLPDVDGDGKLGFLLWDGFPLKQQITIADYGPVLWIHRNVNGTISSLDRILTRQFARELSGAYRHAFADWDLSHRERRMTASGILHARAMGERSYPEVAPWSVGVQGRYVRS